MMADSKVSLNLLEIRRATIAIQMHASNAMMYANEIQSKAHTPPDVPSLHDARDPHHAAIYKDHLDKMDAEIASMQEAAKNMRDSVFEGNPSAEAAPEQPTAPPSSPAAAVELAGMVGTHDETVRCATCGNAVNPDSQDSATCYTCKQPICDWVSCGRKYSDPKVAGGTYVLCMECP